MMDDISNSLYIFIDASNLWQAQKAKGRFLDYQKIVEHIQKTHAALQVKVFYYTAYPAAGTRGYDMAGKHNFFTFLKKGLNFIVRKKELKRIKIVDEFGESVQEKGNMDVEMTIDAIHHMHKFDTTIFFTGDSDFLALVTYLKNAGKKVSVYSSKNNISQELRTGADGYVDVMTLGEEVWGRLLVRRSV